MAARSELDLEGLGARIAALPGAERVRAAAAAAGLDAYLVGGSVRDALLGRERADLDVVVAGGDHLALAAALEGEVRVHDRFGTATISLPGADVDVAMARAESYARPGALPEVRPADLREDLARRDFTVNAMAVPLGGRPFELIDPHGGVFDLAGRTLRLLHERSFADDPTRALRAARYATRYALALEERTDRLLRAADLRTVSAERTEAELRKLAREPDPVLGLSVLIEWGIGRSDPKLAGRALRVVARELWRGVAEPADVLLEAGQVRAGRFRAREAHRRARELATVRPLHPSEGVAAARGRRGVELVIARALGAAWLDDYVREWRHVRLGISGHDLLEAGVSEGPAIGRGLAAALRGKLDGDLDGRDAELATALRAAGG